VQKNASRLGEYFVDYLRLLRRSLMKSRLALPCLASDGLVDATEIGGCLRVAAASLPNLTVSRCAGHFLRWLKIGNPAALATSACFLLFL
jgi:hypothetical protein